MSHIFCTRNLSFIWSWYFTTRYKSQYEQHEFLVKFWTMHILSKLVTCQRDEDYMRLTFIRGLLTLARTKGKRLPSNFHYRDSSWISRQDHRRKSNSRVFVKKLLAVGNRINIFRMRTIRDLTSVTRFAHCQERRETHRCCRCLSI